MKTQAALMGSNAYSAASEEAAIGRDIETNRLITLGDTGRRRGLYVLGRSGTGKTELLKRLILSDINKGYGAFFLDPHYDAIEDLIKRVPAGRVADVISINPEHETHSFGINLLACADIHSWRERESTYNRAKGVFDKLWKNMPEELPWLQLIIEYTLPVFIQNPQYTLADVPQFLSDPQFRNDLLSNLKYDPDVKDFWRSQFHQKQAEAAITRVRMLLGRPPVKHIVSQVKTSIDFARIIKEKRILFVTLSANLSADTKKFIGTILISELLHAVRKRAELPERDRHQFCIFIDEFQHFANSEDCATLINEARKFGIATAVAHQERYGQFADDKKLLGATDAAGNKIFFGLGIKDAEEQALEFAKPPPTETKREQELVVSQSPVYDLLRGHKNRQIQAFVDRCLRPIQEQIQDAGGEIEEERLIRTDMLDQAAGLRLDERVDWLRQRGTGSQDILNRAEGLVQLARAQTGKIQNIVETSRRLRQLIRDTNRFLTSVMQGEVVYGSEKFSDFLIDKVRGLSRVSETEAKLLELYIVLNYGDEQVERTIPVDVARLLGFGSGEIRSLTYQSEMRTNNEREAFREAYISREMEAYYASRYAKRKREESARAETHAQALNKIRSGIEEAAHGRIFGGDIERYARLIYLEVVWLLCYRDLLEIVMPFSKARFNSRWKGVVEGLDELIEDIVQALKPSKMNVWEKIIYEERAFTYRSYLKEEVTRRVEGFLKEYREGAFVMLKLLYTAQTGEHELYAGGYSGECLIALPGIKKADPLAIYRLIGRLNAALFAKHNPADIAKFLKHFDFKRHERECSTDYGKTTYSKKGDKFIWQRFPDDIIGGIRCSALRDAGFPDCPDLQRRQSDKLKIEYRDDVKFLRQALKERWGRLSEYSRDTAMLWEESDELTRSYLLGRACDLVSFGEEIANVTFPVFDEIYFVWLGKAAHVPFDYQDSAICTREQAVKALAWLFKDTQKEIARAKERREEEYEEGKIEKECGWKLDKISYSPPSVLSPRVLSFEERRDLRQTCIDKIRQAGGEALKVAATIEELASVCRLLSEPENQIRVPSGQYVIREAPARAEQDMTNEMARELVGLPQFIAYAKVLQERGEVEEVWKGKIQTLKLEALTEGERAGKERQDEIERRSLSYLKRRVEIEEETRLRQEGWRRKSVDEALPSVSQESPVIEKAIARQMEGIATREGAVADSPQAPVVERDEPPPVSHR